MITAGWLLLGLGAALFGYAYAGYPLALWIVGQLRGRRPAVPAPAEWPLLSVVVPAYNEEGAIARTLDRILAADYPAERRQVLVVSDCSSDRTDDIVRGYADRGVELLRLPERRGKTAAEQAAFARLRGDVIINTDASVRIHPQALRALTSAFADPTVGVASSRDVSVGAADDTANIGEGGYVGYEMWVRGLETRVYGIVGASGSLYASRSMLHRSAVPDALSRDFASPLLAREQGYRSVSVAEAVCYVPRASSLKREYRRKVRTMTRGLETLWHKRSLMNPLRYGAFAWMLLSHKLVRWLVPPAMLLGLVGLALLAPFSLVARLLLLLAVAGAAAGLLGWFWPREDDIPRPLAIPAYIGSALVASLQAWTKALGGELNPVWEPTRRRTPVETG